MQDVSAAIDETMGEVVFITPVLRRPNFPATPDESQRSQVVAVFFWKAKSVFREEGGKKGYAGQSSFTPLLEVSSRDPVFTFTAKALPFPILQGYRIERRCDGSAFEVTSVKPDGVARVTVDVVQLGRPSAGAI
jgi:hypothetical protein